MGLKGLGFIFRIKVGSGMYRIESLAVKDLGFKDQIEVTGYGLRVPGYGLRVTGLGFRV